MRVRKRSNEARPYIARLRVFNRFTWPSTTPELQGRVSPAANATIQQRLVPVHLFYDFPVEEGCVSRIPWAVGGTRLVGVRPTRGRLRGNVFGAAPEPGVDGDVRGVDAGRPGGRVSDRCQRLKTSSAWSRLVACRSQ